MGVMGKREKRRRSREDIGSGGKRGLWFPLFFFEREKRRSVILS